MSLLKDVNLLEDGGGGGGGGGGAGGGAGGAAGGSVGAGSIAGFRGSLFGSMVKRQMPKVAGSKKKKGPVRLKTWFEARIEKTATKIEKTATKPIVEYKQAYGMLTEIGKVSPQNNANMGQDKQNFDSAEVFSKLKALDKRNDIDHQYDSSTFGLEDENGGIVRVTVKGEQAEEFEKALQQFLSNPDDSHNDEGRIPDIGEILFDLKDRFDILNVVWPEVQEDEEEPQEVAGQEGQGDNTEAPEGEGEGGGEMTAGQGEEGGEDMNGLGGEGGEEMSATSALTAVIDAMKADAEARKAEADARTAEAKSREADLTTRQSEAKVKQEEEILDMDDYYKSKKDAEKEAKQLAKLAKWKHEMAREKGEEGFADQHAEGADDEDEEFDLPTSRVNAREIADAVMKKIR